MTTERDKAVESTSNGQRLAELLAAARDAEITSREHANELYEQALREDPLCLAAHNAVERLGGPTSYGRWMGIDCTIDERDDIFRFFANHPISANPVREYLSDGWRTLSELMALLERNGRSLSEMRSVLEFAAGFGRFTRHLVKVLPARVSCAEIVPGAVDFLCTHFGVAAFGSARDPEAIQWPRRYDMVFVLSLFTHLPLSVWNRWLRKLAAAVEPGGVLLFSIHNEARARELGVVFDDDGGRFVASSESGALDAGDYGTTFTTLERALRETSLALPGASVGVHSRAFWDGQDGILVRL